MDREKLEQGLAQCTGTEEWHKHQFGLTYTDGIKFLAEEAGAYWLIDAIASYRKKEPFQVWTLTVTIRGKERRAVLEMREDTDAPVLVHQDIEFTDFPLPEIKLYLVDGVLLLPSEY
jgi:hypothetical protein